MKPFPYVTLIIGDENKFITFLPKRPVDHLVLRALDSVLNQAAIDKYVLLSNCFSRGLIIG